VPIATQTQQTRSSANQPVGHILLPGIGVTGGSSGRAYRGWTDVLEAFWTNPCPLPNPGQVFTGPGWRPRPRPARRSTTRRRPRGRR
jgi:hypothetical protein